MKVKERRYPRMHVMNSGDDELKDDRERKGEREKKKREEKREKKGSSGVPAYFGWLPCAVTGSPQSLNLPGWKLNQINKSPSSFFTQLLLSPCFILFDHVSLSPSCLNRFSQRRCLQ